MEFVNLKSCLDRLVDTYNTPGVDCIVCMGNEQVFRYYTGMSDLENQIPMNGKELYQIFSMTKMLTCTCALQLFEKGKFCMDDPLAKFFPEFAHMKIAGSNSEIKNPITIRNLFTMTAGFDYNVRAPYIKDAISQGRVHTLELVRELSHASLMFEPGTRFKYSLCHDVLGALVEVWSGMKFGDYMKKNILEPLGMHNTFFGTPKDEETLSKMAALYTYELEGEGSRCDSNGNRLPIRIPLGCYFNLTDEYESGGAGLVSCAEDYSVFLGALANGGVSKDGERILKSSTVELMHTNQLSAMALEDFYKLRNGYGYGMGVRTHIDSSASGSMSPLGEFGWDGAAGAFSLVDTKSKLSLTYFQHVLEWDLKIQEELRNALYMDIINQGGMENEKN